MFCKTLIGLYILVIGLLVSNVLSLAWMLIIQVAALAGLVLIGTLIVQGFLSKEPNLSSQDKWMNDD